MDFDMNNIPVNDRLNAYLISKLLGLALMWTGHLFVLSAYSSPGRKDVQS